MLFNSLSFLASFSILLLLLWCIPRQRDKKILLLAYSYFFYGCWDYRFLALIVGSSLTDFYIGKWLYIEKAPSIRKRWLIASVFVNLGSLGFFKYYNFFVDSLSPLISSFGWDAGTLEIILPVGISFFTFQSMSYTIDIYREKLEPCHDLSDFLLFVAFFPQLVAGPIVRAADFLPQLTRPIRLTKANLNAGSMIFLGGLLKKLLIADKLSIFVDCIFANPQLYDGVTLWLATLSYGIQIYCDFCGYSDMAIGLGRILGFKLPINFRFPYGASDIQEFWRRWHVSLSSWLRDYLYFSLGGNRGTAGRTYANLMLTMLLGGLWHGAGWNFLLWGFLHGFALVLHKLLIAVRPEKTTTLSSSWNILGWSSTFLFVLLCWIPFRSETFANSIIYFRGLFLMQEGVRWIYLNAITLPIAIFALDLMERRGVIAFEDIGITTFRGAFVFAIIAFAIVLFAPTDANPFIYFQF